MPQEIPAQIILLFPDSPEGQAIELSLSANPNLNPIWFQNPTALHERLHTLSPLVVLLSGHFGEKRTGEEPGPSACFEIATEIERRFPASATLLLSEKENVLQLKQALRSGISDVLFAPYSPQDLQQAVIRSLEKARRIRDWTLLETRRVTAGLQRQLTEFETLANLGRTVILSLDLDETLSAIVEAAVSLTHAEEGSLLLLDEANGELYVRAARNFNEEFARTLRLPVQDTLAGSVIRTGQPVVIDESTPQKIKTSYLVQNLIYVPLQMHGQVIGVLGVDNRKAKITFGERHVKLLAALAEFATIALENARLYASTLAERNKLETTLTQVSDGVIVVDLDQRLTLVNQAARQIFQLGEASLNAHLFEDIFPNSELIDLLAAGKKIPSNRVELATSGESIYSCQATPIPDVGQVITLTDITHLKKLDRIKNDFVNTVSHDLRSPLTAILGYVDLIERAGPVNDLQRDFIRRVQGSVQNITILVNDLLNLGRIEAGFDTRKEHMLLEPILREAIEGYHALINERKVHFFVNLALNDSHVFGNPSQIRQVANNLIGNALKYTPVGGSIKVQTQITQNQVLFQIGDTGIGIPANDLPFIFEKFYRAGNITSEISGTGLGLAIVKSIIENHQGRIWVDSVVGKGSLFSVVFPQDPVEEGL